MTRKKDMLSSTQKFSLSLISKSNKKRIAEANEKLKSLYPFEIERNKLYICGTSNKGIYDVYVSDTVIENNNKAVRIIILVFLILLIGLICFAGWENNKNRKNTANLKKQQEVEAAEQEKERKEKENRLILLQQEYEILRSKEYEKVFPRLEQIYSAIKNGTVIENLSIDKNSFFIEITTKDALAIFASLEESSAFTNVKMNRTTIENAKEYVTYSGQFPFQEKMPDKGALLEDKILFYETEIKQLKNKFEKQETIQLPDYVKHIRDILHSNNCNEQYIQLRNADESAEVEFFVESKSNKILNFLKIIQDDKEYLYDIKQIKIRNRGGGEIQTTLCFDSRLKTEKGVSVLNVPANGDISASEIEKIFYKPAVQKVAAKPQISEKKAEVKVIPEKKVTYKSLSFLGLSKLNGKTMVAVKDENMGSIYSLQLKEFEPSDNSDFCIQNENNYLARIRGEYYEVKK